MSDEFALPVGHDPNSLSQLNFCLDRPFLQPFNIQNYHQNYCNGLEIWLDENNSHNKLYSMFEGTIEYYNETSGNGLIVTLNESSLGNFEDIQQPGPIEPPANKIKYENVYENDVSSIFYNLIQNQHTYALNNPTDSWHSIMNIKFLSEESERPLVPMIIKEYIDHINLMYPSEDPIQEIVDSFINDGQKLSVSPGDKIGNAGPSIHTPPCTLSSSTYTKIVFTQYNNNFINPLYYIWWVLKNAFDHNNPIFNVLTQVNYDSNYKTFSHPLLASTANGGVELELDYNQMELPRNFFNVSIGTDHLYFPLYDLAEWHGYEENYEGSYLVWKNENEVNNRFLQFKVNRRSSHAKLDNFEVENFDVRLCGESFDKDNEMDLCTNPNNIEESNVPNYSTEVTNIWNNFSQDLTDICDFLQFPIEIAIGIIGHESYLSRFYGWSSREIRFEPIVNPQTQLQTTFDNDFGRNGNGSNLILPDPYDDTEEVTDAQYKVPNNLSSPGFTWGDFKQVLANKYDDPYYVCSVGLFQITIATAIERMNDLENLIPNYSNLINVNNHSTDPVDMFDWLTVPRNNILAGVFKLKNDYKINETYIDLPIVTSVYNQGANSRDEFDNDPYGLDYTQTSVHYPTDVARWFNAFVLHYQNNNIAVSSKFKENL